MDPETCLNRIAADIATEEFASAVEGLNNYYRYRLAGGFEPEFDTPLRLSGDVYADQLATQLVDQLVWEDFRVD